MLWQTLHGYHVEESPCSHGSAIERSVRARGKNNSRQSLTLTAMKISKAYAMKFVIVKCHRNGSSSKEENETMVNPASEKPKFGRGVFEHRIGICQGIRKLIDRCLPPSKLGYRTWLIKCYLF